MTKPPTEKIGGEFGDVRAAIDVEKLNAYLQAHVPEVTAPVTVKQFKVCLGQISFATVCSRLYSVQFGQVRLNIPLSCKYLKSCRLVESNILFDRFEVRHPPNPSERLLFIDHVLQGQEVCSAEEARRTTSLIHSSPGRARIPSPQRPSQTQHQAQYSSRKTRTSAATIHPVRR